MVVLRDNFVQVRLGVGSTGFAALFYPGRHLVQVVSGLNMLDLVVAGARPSLWLYILTGGCFETLGELFSVGPLCLRADHRGGQSYRDLDSQLNLAHFLWQAVGADLVELQSFGHGCFVCLVIVRMWLCLGFYFLSPFLVAYSVKN